MLINPVDHLPLVSFVIGRTINGALSHHDREELHQVGAIGLVRAARSFDSTRGAFSTFACACVRSSILNELRRRRPPGTSIYSRTPDDFAIADTIAAPAEPDPLMNKEEVRQLLRVLAPLERRVIVMRFGLDGRGGMTLAAIAATLGVSRMTAFNISKRALLKLRKAVGHG